MNGASPSPSPWRSHCPPRPRQAVPERASVERPAIEQEPAPVDSCDAYDPCIDSCAEDYAHRVDSCVAYVGDCQEECISLSVGVHQECLLECGPRPGDC